MHVLGGLTEELSGMTRTREEVHAQNQDRKFLYQWLDGAPAAVLGHCMEFQKDSKPSTREGLVLSRGYGS